MNWCEKVQRQDSREIKAFGYSRERMLTVRLREGLRDELNRIAKRKGTSLNLMVRKMLLELAVSEKGASDGE